MAQISESQLCGPGLLQAAACQQNGSDAPSDGNQNSDQSEQPSGAAMLETGNLKPPFVTTTDIATTPKQGLMKPPTKRKQPEPAAPPTEFQQFTANSIGKTLPIFGSSLFDHSPDTFAPLDRVPVASDYVLGPGDEILMRVWGQINMNSHLQLDRAGAVYVPQVGTITLAGLPYDQVPTFLRTQLGHVYRNFDLSVNMGQLRSVQVFVVGQVKHPGSYTVSSLSTLVNALFASGGPSSEGSMRHIQLKRGSRLVSDFDLYDLLLKGDKSKDARVMDGDVIYVPAVRQQVAVSGSVRNPGIFELNQEHTVAEVIQLAGGLSELADREHGSIERIQQRSSREAHRFALDAGGLQSGVTDGDLINVAAIPPRFTNTVTIRGNVANPGRFPWHEGMLLREIIPNKESLITRDYWDSQNNLGFVKPETAEDTPQVEPKPKTDKFEFKAPDINWAYAVIERQNDTTLSTELIPFNLGKLVMDNDERQNLALRPGDVVTVFSQADLRIAQAQQKRTVRLEGEFNSAGLYTVKPGETLGQLIARAGGLTPDAYIFGSELRRESVRKDQEKRFAEFTERMQQELQQMQKAKLQNSANAEDASILATQMAANQQSLERFKSLKPTGRIVLHLDPSGDDFAKALALPLEDGDTFLVPAKPATVNVVGAVYNQGSYIHEDSMKLAEYLRESGGPNRQADRSREFIIRADGTVIPRDSEKRSFDSLHLNPGDSLVVPEVAFKTSALRGVKDWSQVISQFALGAAAVNVLK